MPDSSDQRVYQQIQQSADYYEPAIYELLSFYSSLQNEPDELDGQFIPLTSVPYKSAHQTLIFAVGVLPPSSNVTGRLLDRSASVARITGDPGQEINALQVKDGGPNLGTGVPGTNAAPPIMNQLSFQQRATAIRDAWRARFHTDPSSATLALLVAHSQVETGGNLPNYNFGFIGNYTTPPNNRETFAWHPGGTPEGFTRYFNSYQSAQDGASGFLTQIIASGGLEAAQNGDVQAYAQALFDHHYYGPPSPDVYAAAFPNLSFIQAQVGNVANLDPNSLPPPLKQQIGGDSLSSTSWQTSGSDNANQAQKDASKASNKNLNRTNLGSRFLAAQAAIIKSTLAAIDRMKNTPPLRMLVNPQSFRIAPEKIIADGSWGRNGPIVEHWGENQDKIEASGKIAGFYSIDAVAGAFIPQNSPSRVGSAGNSPGLTRIARQFSKSYQNFLSLWLLYKNNGGVWLNDFINTSSSRTTNLSAVGSIYIYYDGTLYLGSFDNFSIAETDTAPFTLEYNFTFTVRASFLLDQLDAQSLTYGAPGFMQGNAPTNQVNTTPNALGPNVNAQPSPTVPPAPTNRGT
jgi:hypothetical protein